MFVFLYFPGNLIPTPCLRHIIQNCEQPSGEKSLSQPTNCNNKQGIWGILDRYINCGSVWCENGSKASFPWQFIIIQYQHWRCFQRAVAEVGRRQIEGGRLLVLWTCSGDHGNHRNYSEGNDTGADFTAIWVLWKKHLFTSREQTEQKQYLGQWIMFMILLSKTCYIDCSSSSLFQVQVHIQVLFVTYNHTGYNYIEMYASSFNYAVKICVK